MIITEDAFMELTRPEIYTHMRNGDDFSQVAGDILAVYAPTIESSSEYTYYCNYLLWGKTANLSFETKKNFVSILFHTDEVRQWAFQNYKEPDLSKLHRENMASGMDAICSAKNSNHTVRSVMEFMRNSSSKYTVARFVKHSDDALWTTELVEALVELRPYNLTTDVLARKVRKVFKLDNNTPDEWVLRMFAKANA